MLGFGQDECQFCSEFISEVCLHRQHSMALLAGDSLEFQFPACYRMCLIPGRLLFMHLARIKGFHLSRWRLDCCKCIFCIFSTWVRYGLGHLLFLTTQKIPKPVTHCHRCVDRAVGQLKPSNPTLQQVLCDAVPSRVTQHLPALLFHCCCSERDLEEALTSLCTCLNAVQDSWGNDSAWIIRDIQCMWRLFAQAKLQIKKYLPVHTFKWLEAAEVVTVFFSRWAEK